MRTSMESVDDPLARPVQDLVDVVAEEEGGVVVLFHGLDPLQVVVELVGGGIDGAPRGQGLAVAVSGVDGVTGGEDGAVVLGLQDQADDPRGVGGLDEKAQVVGQPGGVVDRFKPDALHVEEGADVGPVVPRGHRPPGLLQVGLGHQDVAEGLRRGRSGGGRG